MFFFDSHLHLVHCDSPLSIPDDFDSSEIYRGISCALGKSEFEAQEALISAIEEKSRIRNLDAKFLKSFAVHPQDLQTIKSKKNLEENIEFLEFLLAGKKIDFIGEFGFDFFTEEFRQTEKEQSIAFREQISLAEKYSVPVIIHARKSMQKIFEYSSEFKKLPAVIFHSYAGTFIEAESLLRRRINAFFSFGKPLLNGKKSAIECVKKLNEEFLLFETDSPYQTLKGEVKTSPSEIKKVYRAAAAIRETEISLLAEKIRPPVCCLH